MKDGFYWFTPTGEQEYPDFDHPQPVEIRGTDVYLAGTNETYSVTDAKGSFVWLPHNDL